MENASMAPAFVTKTSQLRIAQYPFTKSQQYPGKRANERTSERANEQLQKARRLAIKACTHLTSLTLCFFFLIYLSLSKAFLTIWSGKSASQASKVLDVTSKVLDDMANILIHVLYLVQLLGCKGMVCVTDVNDRAGR